MYQPDDFFYHDADFEMAELEAAGRRQAALRKKGICTHGWMQTQPDKTVKCLDCGKTFPNDQAWHQEYREML